MADIADPNVPTKVRYLRHPTPIQTFMTMMPQVFVVQQVWSIGITLCELVTNLGFTCRCLALVSSREAAELGILQYLTYYLHFVMLNIVFRCNFQLDQVGSLTDRFFNLELA